MFIYTLNLLFYLNHYIIILKSLNRYALNLFGLSSVVLIDIDLGMG
ncbi:MAG: hypothetical protein U9N49_00510 [Campylobacterota bacterium]|nr:hypothetical protein [Campylobacterota bacterium]